VTISYKWKKVGFIKKNKSLRLVLKIRNDNPHKVLVRFQVNYYWKAMIKASSQKNGILYLTSEKDSREAARSSVKFLTILFSKELFS
jgi:hypothetical protein